MIGGLIGSIRNYVAEIAARSIGVVRQYLKFEGYKYATLPKLLEWEPDVIHCHDLITLPAGKSAAAILDSKLVYDAHELEEHRAHGVEPPPFVRRISLEYERQGSRAADAVIAVCDTASEYLKNRYEIEKPYVVHNAPPYPQRITRDLTKAYPFNEPWFDTSKHWIKPGPLQRDIRVDAGVSKRTKLLVYVGLVTMNRGIEIVLEALKYVPGAHLATVGPQREQTVKELKALAKKLGVSERFSVLDPVNPEHVVDYVKGADIGVLPPLPVTLSYEWSMPNKMFEMSFAGLPILASDLIGFRSYVLKHDLGLTYEPEDPEDCARKLFAVMQKYPKRRVNDPKITALHKDYNWHAQCRVLSELYDKIGVQVPENPESETSELSSVEEASDPGLDDKDVRVANAS